MDKPTDAEVLRVAKIMGRAARRESIRIKMDVPVRDYEHSDRAFKALMLAAARAAIKALQKKGG